MASPSHSRRLVWLALLLLVILNLVVGGLAYRYLAKVDANYTLLLEEGIPFLNDMQTVTAQASRAYSLLVDLSQAETPEEVAGLEKNLAAVRAVSDKIYSSPADEKAVPADLRAEYDSLRQMRLTGRARVQTFLDLVHQRKTREASDFLRHEVAPIQKAYVSRLDRFCDIYQDKFEALNEKLTDENNHNRLFLFGIAAAPMFILLGLIVLAVLGLVSAFALVLSSRLSSARYNDPRSQKDTISQL